MLVPEDASKMTRVPAAVLLIIVAAAMVLMNAQTKPRAPISQSGRYALFSAEHEVLLKTGSSTEKVILRIDTQTGTVYQWMDGYDKDGNLLDTWLLIGERRLGAK